MGDRNKKASQDKPPSYVKYIGLAFQMCAVIGLGTWAGLEIQKKSEMTFPVWVLFFCFLSIFVAFYQLYRSIKQDE
jgi:hypothetical protein